MDQDESVFCLRYFCDILLSVSFIASMRIRSLTSIKFSGLLLPCRYHVTGWGGKGVWVELGWAMEVRLEG
jgi:hypothetical protein